VIAVFLAFMYLMAWGLAMGTAAAGLWPAALVAGLVMGGLCFHHEIRHMYQRVTRG
jgi:hypothetical protein